MRLELRLEHRAQPERDVGVLARVVARGPHGHHVEGELRAPAPAQLLVRRHLVVDELQREHVEGVRAAPRVEHVAGEHRVEVEPAERDPGAAQREHVVLRVLGGLPHRRVLEQRAERRHLGRRDVGEVPHRRHPLGEDARGDRRRRRRGRGGLLLRRLLLGGRGGGPPRVDGTLGSVRRRRRFVAFRHFLVRVGGRAVGVVGRHRAAREQVALLRLVAPVAQRQVVRLARRRGHRDPHEHRPQRVHLVRRPRLEDRLGVHGDVPRLARARDHPGERLQRVHGRVAHDGRVGRGGGRRRRHRLGERGELELQVEGAQPVVVGLPEPQRVEVELHVEVLADRHELLGEPRLVGVLLQRLARALLRDARDVLQDALQRAVLVHELARRLVADPRDAGHVVARVAHEREVVGDERRGDAEPLGGVLHPHPLLLDARRPAAPGVEEEDARRDELLEVLVARDDHHVLPGGGSLAGERADHVVGLVPLLGEDRDVVRLEQRAHALHPAVEVVLQPLAQLLARGLVRRVLLVAERQPGVVHPAEVLGAVRGDEALQEVGDPPRGARVLAAARGEGARDEGEERAVDERVAVDEEEARRLRARDLGRGGEREVGHEAGGRSEVGGGRSHLPCVRPQVTSRRERASPSRARTLDFRPPTCPKRQPPAGTTWSRRAARIETAAEREPRRAARSPRGAPCRRS